MKKLTNKISLIAATIFLVLLCALLYSVHTVNSLGHLYTERHQMIAEQQSKEKAHFDTLEIIERSAADRETLASFFLSEKDTIEFINTIESYARDNGLELETTQLAVDPKTEKSEAMLKIGFKFGGSFAAVTRMVNLFETLPFHKFIPEMSLTAAEAEGWTGTITLHLTIKP